MPDIWDVRKCVRRNSVNAIGRDSNCFDPVLELPFVLRLGKALANDQVKAVVVSEGQLRFSGCLYVQSQARIRRRCTLQCTGDSLVLQSQTH